MRLFTTVSIGENYVKVKSEICRWSNIFVSILYRYNFTVIYKYG